MKKVEKNSQKFLLPNFKLWKISKHYFWYCFMLLLFVRGFFFFFFWERVSVCNPDWYQPCDPPASTSWVLGLQACTSMPGFKSNLRELRTFFFFSFSGTRALNSGLCVCKAGLYCLSHTSRPFCCGYFFGDGGLMNYFQILILLISPSYVARITGVSHEHLAKNF
jgi:hypothetical protein